MADAKTIETYNSKADGYASLISRSIPDQDLRNFIDAVPLGGLVLDLGCGPGNSAAMMLAEGLKVDAIDASEKMIELARSQFNVAANLATFDDLDAQNHYDGIWANFSLLHAPKSDMPRHLKAIHNALKEKGHFHIGMKLGAGEQRDTINRMYTYYQEAELSKYLSDAGFTVLSTRIDEMMGLAGDVEPFIIITAHA
jgi:trans-aconitate methyltransferase